jgi:hypothetical protein
VASTTTRALGALVLAVMVLGAGPAFAAPPGDADADGLPDAWETHGVLVDTPAGARWVDLPAMGADPARPDIFLQIDWMADAGHDQRPHPEALAMVRAAFADAPWVSPTGSVGIAVHIDAGPDSVLAPGRTWGTLSRARVLPWRENIGSAATDSYDWHDYEEVRDEPGGFTDTGRGPIFHYAVFGHFHDQDAPGGGGASGISNGIGGTNLLVTLGNFTDGVGTPLEQAGTLMHELGHNLGLRHGGCDDANMKPGYASVMNYAFQMQGLVRAGRHGVIDYARGVEPALDDALASQSSGLLALPAPPSRASVATGDARSGSAVRRGGAPGAAPPADTACADGAAIDDWARVRLRVRALGAPAAARWPVAQ